VPFGFGGALVVTAHVAVATDGAFDMAKRKHAQQEKPIARAKTSRKTALKAGPPTTRSKSKQERVLGMLSRPGGTTIAAVMKATGWQQHSVRGFFAGVVRKKLKLTLESAKTNGERTYRVVADKPAKPKDKVAAVGG
jgi:hypothetical protein